MDSNVDIEWKFDTYYLEHCDGDIMFESAITGHSTLDNSLYKLDCMTFYNLILWF